MDANKIKFCRRVSGDELLSDSFPYKEIENGVLWEVEGKVGNFVTGFSLLQFS